MPDFYFDAPAPYGRLPTLLRNVRDKLRGSASRQGAGGGMEFRCRRRKILRQLTTNDLKFRLCHSRKTLPGFCAAGPALTRGAGALCLATLLRKPAASESQRTGRALFPFARFGAALRLLAALGALWSPRGPANPLRGFAFNVCSSGQA